MLPARTIAMLLAALLCARTSAAQSFEARRDHARSRLLAGLEEQVDLCHGERTFRERNLAFGLILRFDPEHSEARRFLRYKRDRKRGVWVRGRYSEPRPGPADKAAEAAQRRIQLVRAYTATVFEALLEHRAEMDKERGLAELKALIEIDPDNPRLREYNGDVRVEVDGKPTWLSKATVVSRARRREMAAVWRELLDGVELRAPRLLPYEASFDFEWTGVSGTSRVAVLGTCSQEEVEDIARHVHAAWSWFDAYLGGKGIPDLSPPRQDGLRIYVLDEHEAAFHRDYPGLDEVTRAVLPSVSSSWLGDLYRFGCWNDTREGRLDMVLRQTASLYMRVGYRTDPHAGWIEHGLGLYLSHRLVGTRLSFTVHHDERSRSGAAEASLGSWTEDPRADYHALARELLSRSTTGRLANAVGQDVNAMGPDDLLLTHAVAAYLVESCEAGLLGRLFLRVGSGEAVVAVIEEELGTDLVSFRDALVRWLGENPERNEGD